MSSRVKSVGRSLEELEDRHEAEAKKLYSIEGELIKMIAEKNDEQLMNQFLDWQNQRSTCKEIYNKWLRQLVERKHDSTTLEL